jgi:Helix-turn-helix domain
MIDDQANLLWADALVQLKCRLDRATFNAWLLGSHVVESGESTLTVGVPCPDSLPWLQHRLRPLIEQTLRLVAGRPIAVDFVPYSPPPEDDYDEDEDEDEDGAFPAGATASLSKSPGPPPPSRKKTRKRVSPAVISPHRASPERAAPAERKGARHKPATEMGPNDFYIRLKTAFARRALRLCKGAPLSVLNCLWCHMNKDHLAWPSIETIMRQTGYSRGVVCNAIAELVRLRLIAKRPRYNQSTEYVILAYAWFGSHPTPALYEEQEA